MIHKNDQKGILRNPDQLGNFRFHKLCSTHTHTHTHLTHTHTPSTHTDTAHIHTHPAYTHPAHTQHTHTLSTHTHTQHDAHTHTHTQQTKNFSILFKLSVMFLGWGLPFLYMRKACSCHWANWFSFSKDSSKHWISDFPVENLCAQWKDFAVNMWSVKAQQRSRITTVGREVPRLSTVFLHLLLPPSHYCGHS